MAKCILRLVVGLFIFIASSAKAQWLHTEKQGDIAYFLFANSPRIERFSFSTSQWLTPVNLTPNYGPPSTFCLDSNALFVAYGQSVKRYDLNGSGESHVINVADPIQTIFADGNLLIVNHKSLGSTHFTSVNKINGTALATFEKTVDNVYSVTFANSINKIFLQVGVAGSMLSINHDDLGAFVEGAEAVAPYGESDRLGSWVLPDQTKVLDSAGALYNTSDLSVLYRMPGNIIDVDYTAANLPIILRASNLVAYSKTFLPTGSRALSFAPQSIYVYGANIFAFTPDVNKANGIAVNALAISSLTQPVPGTPLDATYIDYTPDNTFLDKDGILYLLSITNKSLFRWSFSNQQYLASIPLADAPSLAAYSAVNHKIYLAYSSGLLQQINLNSTNLVESPFAYLPGIPSELIAAGKYIVCITDAAYPEGRKQNVLDPNGLRIDSGPWGYWQSTGLTWSGSLQKLFFVGNSSQIVTEQLNASGLAYPDVAPGHLGLVESSEQLASGYLKPPIRIAPDSSVAFLASGVILKVPSLSRNIASLGNPVVDIAFGGSEIKTIRALGDNAQFQEWNSLNYSQGVAKIVPGQPVSIHSVNSNLLVAITLSAGRPSFYVMNAKFNILAPQFLDKPSGVLATVQSASKILVTWKDITGETGYTIERKVGLTGLWIKQGSVEASVTSYLDQNVSPGNSYYYRITALNGIKLSSSSSAANITIAAPSTPTALKVIAVSTNSVTIGWNDVQNESSFLIERSTQGDFNWSEIATLPANSVSFTDVLVSPGHDYYYRIRAFNGIGYSAISPVLVATTIAVPPGVIAYFYGSSGGPFGIELSWFAESDAASFVERRLPGGTWNLITSMEMGAHGYVDKELEPDTTYEYRLYLTNRAGISPYSSIASIKTSPLYPPSTPSSLNASVVSSNSIAINWDHVMGEQGYVLQMRTDDPETWSTIATLNSNDTSFVAHNLTQDVRYYFRLQAFNSAGISPFTWFEVSASPVAVYRLLEDNFDVGLNKLAWEQFSGVVTNGGIGFRTNQAFWFGNSDIRMATTFPVDVSQGGTISFLFRAGNEKVDGTNFWNNSEYGEVVALEYSSNGENWYLLQTIDTQYPNLKSWHSFTVTLPYNPSASHTRFRWIQSKHSGQFLDTWALDDVVIFGRLPALPSDPPFLFASAGSSTSVMIYWADSIGASSYLLERKQGSAPWRVIAETAPTQTFFTDINVTSGAAYTYRVKARNAGGDSAYSVLASASPWAQKQQWISDNYGFADALSDSEFKSNKAGGISALLRFGFNLSSDESPIAIVPGASTKGTPFIAKSPTGNRLFTEFVRRKSSSNPQITYAVQFSNDLVTWTSSTNLISNTSLDSIWERVRYEDATPGPIRFCRVVVTPNF